MYREQWVQDILGRRSVLDVALDVHMTHHGSMERDAYAQENDIVALREVESTWKNHGICDFDDAVLGVIRAAIVECGYALNSEMDK